MNHLEETKKQIAERADILKAGKAALCFSGGKDSAACLLLLRPFLESISVLFVNHGRHYPETLAIAERAKAICPKWVEVRTDREGQWKANGLPADLVPVDWTIPGQMLSTRKPIAVQSYWQCCSENISQPLWSKAKELGCSLVIRGQRADEERKGTSTTGSEHEGITFWHPVEKWTRWQVLDYLRGALGQLPAHYHLDHTSLDCFDCTAFTKNAVDRAHYTRTHHPVLYREYAAKMIAVYRPMREQMNSVETVLGILTAN